MRATRNKEITHNGPSHSIAGRLSLNHASKPSRYDTTNVQLELPASLLQKLIDTRQLSLADCHCLNAPSQRQLHDLLLNTLKVGH